MILLWYSRLHVSRTPQLRSSVHTNSVVWLGKATLWNLTLSVVVGSIIVSGPVQSVSSAFQPVSQMLKSTQTVLFCKVGKVRTY